MIFKILKEFIELPTNIFLFKKLLNNFIKFHLQQFIQMNLNNSKFILDTTMLHSWICIHQNTNAKKIYESIQQYVQK